MSGPRHPKNLQHLYQKFPTVQVYVIMVSGFKSSSQKRKLLAFSRNWMIVLMQNNKCYKTTKLDWKGQHELSCRWRWPNASHLSAGYGAADRYVSTPNKDISLCKSRSVWESKYILSAKWTQKGKGFLNVGVLTV